MSLHSRSHDEASPGPHHQDSSAGLMLLGGLGLGAALMYFLDPQSGRRRRALARDQYAHTLRKIQDAERVLVRDASQRAMGLMAQTHRWLHAEEPADDAVLVERIRAALGRVTSHPHAVEVSASQGHVVVRGPVLADEAGNVLDCIERTRGVRSVDNQLDVHSEPGNIPALQGGVRREGSRSEWMQDNWSPTARVIAGTLGAALAAYGILRGGGRGWLVGALGSGLLARAASNRDMKSLVGVGADCQPIEVQKTMHVAAPVERVFEYWRNFENFPQWMSHVREVRLHGPNRYHWMVDGPAGVPVEWISEVTTMLENEQMSWRSEPGSMIDHSGRVTFTPEGSGTRVQVEMCYTPVGGVIGHAVAKAFGSDPKTEMDADLMRLKTLIETGHAPHDSAMRRQPFAGDAPPEGVARH